MAARGGGQRWAIFVHDPDGDSGEGQIVGPFYDAEKADAKAEQITRMADGNMHAPNIECIVLPLMPGASGSKSIIDAVDA